MKVLCMINMGDFDGELTFSEGRIYEVYATVFDDKLGVGYYEVIDNRGRLNLLYENEVEIP